MDKEILKALLNSCDSVQNDLENSADYKRLLQESKFLPTSTDIFNGMSTSLTKLLLYKVSKEAYQRYTVRLHVINIIRNLCGVRDKYEKYKVFANQEEASTLVKNLLGKYLTDNNLDDCDSSSDLSSLTSALMCLTSTNVCYKHHLEKVLVRLSELDPYDDSEYLLCRAVERSSDLNLELGIIEKIYQSQKCKLIEQPLLTDFISSCDSLNKDTDKDNVTNSESISLMNQLYKFASVSSCIFLLVCAFLKEFLVQLDYCPAILNFIQLTLNRIKEYCKSKDILDLYPRRLQSLVILLRIEPTSHTDDSKSETLRMLKDIYNQNEDTVIVLLSHYSLWLKFFGEYLLSC